MPFTLNGYLQRSYPSEYKRYRQHAFIVISIEGSTSTPDPAPPPQEQPSQVPRPPHYAVVQNIVASATPAHDTLTRLEPSTVYFLPSSPIIFYSSVCTFTGLSLVRNPSLVVLYSVRRSLISFRIIQVIHFILYVYYVNLTGFTPFPVDLSFRQFLHFLHYRVLPFSFAYL